MYELCKSTEVACNVIQGVKMPKEPYSVDQCGIGAISVLIGHGLQLKEQLIKVKVNVL